jgi:tetratricopeptide (TPR) repeat protein
MKQPLHPRVADRAREILSVSDEPGLARISPALPVRLRLASVSNPMRSRPYAAPNYLSDLGVRFTDEPRQFFALSQHACGFVALTEDIAADVERFRVAWDEQGVTEQSALWWLEAIVSVAGFWRTAAAAAAVLAASDRRPILARLRASIGSALSQSEPDAACRWFASVGSAPDATPDVAAASIVRAAAVEIKRTERLAAGVRSLEALGCQLDSWRRDHVISDGDRNTLRAVACNLRALAETRTGGLDDARDSLAVAAADIAHGDVVVVDPEQRARYTAQIGLNRVQLTARIEGWREAFADAVEHVRATAASHPESLSEATSFAALAAYRAGLFAEAVPLALEAERAIAHEGAPIRIASARKVLAAALSAAGREREAQTVLERALRDPLGTELISEEAAA